MNSQIKAKQKR